jgi:pSer/pThr/pTyr-binding forkhead associated (FHA) protein
LANNVLLLKHLEAPVESGIFWRILCLTGPTKGEAFILKGQRIILGRSETADIKLQDTKSSREHAEITKSGEDWVITDLGSQNGLLVNDQKVNQAKLKEGDKIVIGTTVFKFSKVEYKNDKKNKFAEPDLVKKNSKNINQDKKKNNVLVIVILLAGFLLIFQSPEKNQETSQAKKRASTAVAESTDQSADYLQALQKKQYKEDKILKAKMESIFKRGLREYREQNFFRAINEFNLALILNPNDPLADFYLRKAKEELDKVIADHNIKAKRDEDSLKYQSAVISYCAIIRLLVQYPEDSRYLQALNNIKTLEAKLGQEPGETQCIQKKSTPE